MDEFLLNQNIITKIFHDLAGPINGITNSFELKNIINDNSKENNEIDELIKFSLDDINHKFKFFRTIYGNENNLSEQDLSSFKKEISNFYKNSKINIKNIDSIKKIFPKKITLNFKAIIANMFLIISTMNMQRGSLTVEANSSELHIIGEANSFNFHDNGLEIINSGKIEEEQSTEKAHIYNYVLLINKYNLNTKIIQSENKITLSLLL